MTEVDREAWDEIQRELREGTPDTPERIALIARADAIYKRMTQPIAGSPEPDALRRLAKVLRDASEAYYATDESSPAVYWEGQAAAALGALPASPGRETPPLFDERECAMIRGLVEQASTLAAGIFGGGDRHARLAKVVDDATNALMALRSLGRAAPREDVGRITEEELRRLHRDAYGAGYGDADIHATWQDTDAAYAEFLARYPEELPKWGAALRAAQPHRQEGE